MRWTAHGRILPPVLALGVLAGCQTATPTVKFTPQEKLAVGNRALDLLLRAAESDLDVVACNAMEALVQVAPHEGAPLFEAATHRDEALVRYAGYMALGQVRACDHLTNVNEGVHDANPQVRLAAAFAAVRCGKQNYARILANTLTDSPDEGLRADAAALIGRLDEPRAAKLLRAARRMPANDRSPRVRVHIDWALAKLGDEASLRDLMMAAQGDTPTRTDALLLMAQLANPKTRDALLYRLANPQEDYLATRLIAARGLGALGNDAGYELSLYLLQYQDPKNDPQAPDDTFAIRSMAIHALAEIGDERALGPLRDIAANSTDERLQVAASYAICKILGMGAE